MTDESSAHDTDRARADAQSVSNAASESPSAASDDRRGFLETASKWSMAGGLVAGYGTLVMFGGRFVYPGKGRPVAWQFVARLADVGVGDAVNFTAPDGAKIVVARLTGGETTRDFIALSRVCPHLGCHVHWEVANKRFFCPCHNGAFDAKGKAIAGPPAQDGRNLAQYPLEIHDDLLFIEVPTEGLNQTQTASADSQTREV